MAPDELYRAAIKAIDAHVAATPSNTHSETAGTKPASSTSASKGFARETITFRNSTSQTALPMRELGSFLPGTEVGGSGIHWNRMNWRFLPYDFQIQSQTVARCNSHGLSPGTFCGGKPIFAYRSS
jgi:hypothetical protein